MHNELRYPAKTHTISEKLSKERNKALHLLPNFFFFLLKKETKNKNNKDMLMEKEMTSIP
jgi:L-lactate utilization protein LutC